MATERRIAKASDRKGLFLEMAAEPSGTTVSEVYRRATSMGDTVTEEAYYNLARRLVHRGLVSTEVGDRGTRYSTATPPDSRWLEEDDLGELVDRDYPLLALPIWKESRRLLNDVPESVWIELRERLRHEDARTLFRDALISYCDDLHAQIADVSLAQAPKEDLSELRRGAENARQRLCMVAKYGLGLSQEALSVPTTIDRGIADYKKAPQATYYNQPVLEDELSRRVAPGPFIVDITSPQQEEPLVISAVDGSMRGGLLSFLGEGSDVELGHSPMVAINTAVGHLNRVLQVGKDRKQVFLRLPERPEDMQRRDNRYSIMAKLLFPDLSDAEYMHAVWNAMDLIEARVAHRTLRRWETSAGIEAPAADLVLRDGALAPQDRDFNHYKADSSYGRIVRDMIETHWEIAKKCRDDAQTFAGVVKAAQLSVYSLVVNWFAGRLAPKGESQIMGWPMHTLNLIADQPLLTRLLTAGRRRDDPWCRTCAVMRPFHATTNYAKRYTRVNRPTNAILKRRDQALADPDSLDQEDRLFWQQFRGAHDPYVQMLENVRYCSFYLGAVPRLDLDKSLPRFDVLVTAPTREDAGDPWVIAKEHVDRLINGLGQNGFDVAAEHRMFADKAKLDVLPSQIIQAHDTVKTWARELLARVQEYIGSLLSGYVSSKRFRGVKIRPFTREELEILYEQLRRERYTLAGEKPSVRAIRGGNGG